MRQEGAGPEPGVVSAQGHEGNRDGGQEAPGREEDDAVGLGGGGGLK